MTGSEIELSRPQAHKYVDYTTVQPLFSTQTLRNNNRNNGNENLTR